MALSKKRSLQIGQGTAAFAGAGLNAYSNYKQGKRLASATAEGYRIGRQNYNREVNQGSAQIGALNTETVGAKNDRIGQYREQMGALRVALAEQGASASSAGAQRNEVSGATGTDLSRLDANNQRQAAAITGNLFDARSGLQIANEQAYDKAKAQADALAMDTLSGFLSAGANTAGAFA